MYHILTWVGKLTYLSASYWNHEDITFDNDVNEYYKMDVR